jgi:hypothetical protein
MTHHLLLQIPYQKIEGLFFLPKKLFFNPFSPEKYLLKETNL